MDCNECGEEFETGQRMVGITGGTCADSVLDGDPMFMPDQDEGYIALPLERSCR